MEFREKYPKQSDEALIIAVVILVVAVVGIIWAIKNNKE
nr:MAG TPA: Cytochrome oxidase maturation protein cbb3-type [Caudoviricetes sp.]